MKGPSSVKKATAKHESPFYPEWLVWAGERTWCAIDFETADGEADSACSVALVRVERGEIVARAHSLIRPPRESEELVHVHGLRWSMLANQPSFDAVWDSLRDVWEGSSYFVAHNANFDRSVLRASLKAHGVQAPDLPFQDTFFVARAAWPELKHYKLNNICEYLGIELVHHDAMSDAEAAARIVFAARLKVAELLGDFDHQGVDPWDARHGRGASLIVREALPAGGPASMTSIASLLSADLPKHLSVVVDEQKRLAVHCDRCGLSNVMQSSLPAVLVRWAAKQKLAHPEDGACVVEDRSLRDLHHMELGQICAPVLATPKKPVEVPLRKAVPPAAAQVEELPLFGKEASK